MTAAAAPQVQAAGAAPVDPPLAFGGFRLGGLPLALPMTALREVVPCTALQPLACPAACVIGGIALRGVLVPVVDLRLALGRPAAPPGPGSCVIVMVEAGCILGLLADGVSGVFNARASAVSRMQPHPQAADAPAAAAILAGTVRVDADTADGAGAGADADGVAWRRCCCRPARWPVCPRCRWLPTPSRSASMCAPPSAARRRPPGLRRRHRPPGR